MPVHLRAVIVGLLVALWCSSLAWAQSSHQGDVEAQLGLSTAQKAQLEAIHARYKTLKQDLAAAVARLRKTVATQVDSDAPDRAAIDRGLQEIVQLEGRRQKVMVEEYFEVLSVLRPEQQRILRQHLVQHILRQRR